MGSLAFIGMNALSVQRDISFDLTNMRLNYLRIILGALFGLVLTLPFGYTGFLEFCNDIAVGSTQVTKPEITIAALILLLPFILGFSTSLVILILNRFVDSVQSFFGASPPSRDRAPRDQQGQRLGLAGHAGRIGEPQPASAATAGNRQGRITQLTPGKSLGQLHR